MRTYIRIRILAHIRKSTHSHSDRHTYTHIDTYAYALAGIRIYLQVISALCHTMEDVLHGLGEGEVMADALHNSIFCLRAIDTPVLMLQQVCMCV